MRRTLALTALALAGCSANQPQTQPNQPRNSSATSHAESVSLPRSGNNPWYANNRAPLRSGPLIKLPVGSFRPDGWLGEHLKLQRDGLTGHLAEISLWLTKERNAWLSYDGSGEYGWEEVPYWLRGYYRLAIILNDKAMLDESRGWIEAALDSQRFDGDFGPIRQQQGKRDLWAQMLMLQILQSHYERTADPRVVPFMTKYFRWQLTIPDDLFLEDYWENSRGGDNLASVYWLYNITGDSVLLDLATKIDRNTADWRQSTNLPNWHVVNIAECFREPATYWLQSGKPADLDATYRNFSLVRHLYGQVPGGMFGADENARPGHDDPHQAAETCSFVEQIQSNRMLSEITGDPAWAQNTEDIAFNSLPAAFMPDYRSLRYLTAPNQVVGDAKNHAPGISNEGPFFLMNPFSSRCCQHNHSSAWVNYAEHAWLATADGGLAAVLYASGELTANAGSGAITIRSTTNYPFDDTICFSITQSAVGEFPLYLRVPTWARNPELRVNGSPEPLTLGNGGYLRIHRLWKAGDEVSLRLPMHVSVRTWQANKNSVSVDYGPLTFSLMIAEKYQIVRSDQHAMSDSGWKPGADPSRWPSHEILPDSPWNYALWLDPADPARSFEIEKRPWPANSRPFTAQDAPIRLHAKGRRHPQWQIDQHGLAGTLPRSPVASTDPLTDITLIPMGAARLRISSFPVLEK